MKIKFKDEEYEFFYHDNDNSWISKKFISLKSRDSIFNFRIEIQLKEFVNGQIDETLIPEFLLFLEKNLQDDIDVTAQKILMPFNKIIDHEYLNHIDKFRFEFDTIYYKEPGRSFNPLYNKIGFNYSLSYKLFHSDYEECYAPYTFYFVDFLNNNLIGCRVDLPY
jgi:hypothetical protein